MKDSKETKTESVIRVLTGFGIFLLGALVLVMHLMKLLPPDWESSRFLTAISIVWAYGGPIFGIILVVIGLYVMGYIDYLMSRFK